MYRVECRDSGRRKAACGRKMLSSLAGLRSKKKFHFDVTFSLQDLVNCTYVTGVIFTKLRLKDGGNFTEVSRRIEVENHCVKWHQEFKFPCKMYAPANTAELEPCICKISVRKETKGGRSYKKLGFVKLNLAEYAGAGETQRKYLLESYNENKHKPDNSILKVKISLRQTSGDVLFKAPRAPVWELSEAEDEGIQADLQSMRSKVSENRTSATSTLSEFSTAGFSHQPGGSLQDMHSRHSSITKEAGQRKSCSAVSLRENNSDSGSSSVGKPSSESTEEEEEEKRRGKESSAQHTEGGTIGSKTPERVASGSTGDIPEKPPRTRVHNERTVLEEELPNRRNSVGSTDLEILNETGYFTHPGVHRRRSTLGIMNHSSSSPHHRRHIRHQSLSISGHSSKSTSAYSTLSERSGTSLEMQETESVGNNRSRISLLPSSRVEQSRVDNKTVVDDLFQNHDLLHTDEEEGSGGLKIYVDKNRGTVTVAGPDLDRKYKNLRPIDLSNHSTSSSNGSSSKSSKPKHRTKIPAHSSTSKDSAIAENGDKEPT